MINRTLLRVKVVQNLFSYYKNEGKTISTAEKELMFSFQKTYDLYFMLLQLMVEITAYARLRIENSKNKLLPTSEERNPNLRFAQNRFILQLEENRQLKGYLSEKKLNWTEGQLLIKELYQLIIGSSHYGSYMESEVEGYEADKALWRKLLTKVILPSPSLEATLEELSIYWINDIDIVGSFAEKTIKKFQQENGEEQPLLPMFHANEDYDYALKLHRKAIENAQEYQELVTLFSKNWEYDRLAYMDTIIMQVAIAEIVNFPTIPVSVTINEFIDISKEYSTQKSGKFINGILDEIVGDLKKNKRLIKALVLQEKK